MTRRTAFFIVALGLATLVQGCGGSEAGDWEAFVFPNRGDLDQEIQIGPFESLVQCREAAQGRLEELEAGESGTYECRKNCREVIRDGEKIPGMIDCEEISR